MNRQPRNAAGEADAFDQEEVDVPKNVRAVDYMWAIRPENIWD